MKRIETWLGTVVLGMSFSFVGIAAAASEASAQTIGVVVGRTEATVNVFDADTDTVLGNVSLPAGFPPADCSIAPDQQTAFVTDSVSRVWVVDLSDPFNPALAAGPNSIALSTAGRDIALTPGGQFAAVCGQGPAVSVVDLATRSEVSTFATGASACNAVEICSDGSVLIGTETPHQVRKLTIDGAGSLADTGHFLNLAGEATNLACSPNADSGLAISRTPAEIKSFLLPELTLGNTRSVGADGLGVRISPDGNTILTRSAQEGSGWNYSPASGTLAALPSYSFDSRFTLFSGIEQLEVHPDGSKFYVSDALAASVEVRDVPTGELLRSMAVSRFPTGICFPNASDDSDGDGIEDGADMCPGTVVPESIPFDSLGVNRWALMDSDGIFDTRDPSGTGPGNGFTLEDTAGCSCEQMVERMGLAQGQSKFGCSNGVMGSWVNRLRQ